MRGVEPQLPWQQHRCTRQMARYWRVRQVPIANSPSPVDLLLFYDETGVG